jgi:hypothetical protein
MVSIQIDAREIDAVARALSRLSMTGSAVALSMAINHTGDRATTVVRRSVAKQTGASYAKVRAETKSYKASVSRIVYDLVGKGERAVGLIHYGASQRAGGVSARPWGKRRVFPGTFIAAPAGRSAQVFRRTGEIGIATAGRYKGQRREKIAKLYGPSIPVEMLRDKTPVAFQNAIAERLPGRVAHEVERLLTRSLPRTRR